MSSSSSNEYLYDYLNYGVCYYDQNYGNENTTPFYPTMGNPLVYYAKVPQPVNCCERFRQQQAKNNPNCFVKAFRWYTQEHIPHKSETPSKPPETPNFAAWLDSKYDEFLEENGDKDNYKLTIKQTSVITNEKNPKTCGDLCNASTKHNKKKRLKNKGSYKNKSRSSRDQSSEKVNTSCHYILRPQNLTRPNSECCQASISVVISGTNIPSRQTCKSQSCTQIYQRNRNEPLDIIKTQEGVKTDTEKPLKGTATVQKIPTLIIKDNSCQYSGCRIQQKSDAWTQYGAENEKLVPSKPNIPILKMRMVSDKSLQMSEVAIKNMETMPSKSLQNVPNIYCQCSHGVSKTDAQTQVQVQELSNICLCPKVPEPSNQTIASKKVSSCPCETTDDKIIAALKESRNSQCNLDNCISQTAPLKTLSNCAQTSNYSIILEKDTDCGYPFFMKVVCADKLSKENFSK